MIAKRSIPIFKVETYPASGAMSGVRLGSDDGDVFVVYVEQLRALELELSEEMLCGSG